MIKQIFFIEIFDKKRQALLNQFGFLKNFKAYLAGGSALALQIGHRTSIDFDFYTPKSFKKEDLPKIFIKEFGDKVEIVRNEEDTFTANIDGVHISCFYYNYPLIRPLLSIESIKMTSSEDIAAMKIIAITQRATKRDYIDLYYLIKKFGLGKIFSFTLGKYPKFNIYMALRALEYFEDIEPDIRKLRVFDRKFSWNEARKFLQKEAISFQKKYLK